jgi:hypothetical protein
MRKILPCLMVLALTSPVFADETRLVLGEDEESGLKYWEWQHQGVRVRLVQRLPDQTRAFFLARGFDASSSDQIATACVFQTIFRNEGDESVDFDLGHWRIRRGEVETGLHTREVWESRWQGSGVGKQARVALNWSLLPTQQHFEPGDYNWGMTSFGLGPGSVFDLHLKMVLSGNAIEGEIPGVICAGEMI